jgi:hypothetical protein
MSGPNDQVAEVSHRPFSARMAASAAATECAAFEALEAAYLNGFAGVRGRCRADDPCGA